MVGKRHFAIGLAAGLLFVIGSCGEEGEEGIPKVPDVVGDSSAIAERKLSDAGILVRFEQEPTSEAECRVTEQSPGPGAEAGPDTEVRLRCEVEVPDVVGEKAQEAEATLDELKFKPTLVNRPPKFDLRPCRVKAQSREGAAPPGADVRLTLKCKSPPPPPKP